MYRWNEWFRYEVEAYTHITSTWLKKRAHGHMASEQHIPWDILLKYALISSTSSLAAESFGGIIGMGGSNQFLGGDWSQEGVCVCGGGGGGGVWQVIW